jgi:hypothetical protein
MMAQFSCAVIQPPLRGMSEAARGAAIDALGDGVVALLSIMQAKGKTPVVAPGRFVIEPQDSHSA